MSTYKMLLSRVRLVRGRWRRQMLLKGISLCVLAAVGLLVLGVWGAGLFGFRPAALWAVRSAAAAVIAFAVFRFLFLPLRRRVTDVQIAQFVEERYPQLEDRLVSAVEFGHEQGLQSGMVDLLIRDALDKTNRLDLSVFTEGKRTLAYVATGAAGLFVLLALMSRGPSVFHYGFDRLYTPWTEAADNSGRLIHVTPGNVELAKGSDQQITAQLVGFDSSEVNLYAMPATSTAWLPSTMEPEPRGSSFRYLLVDIQTPLRYYVEARGVRSPTYILNVTDLPRVERIDLTYHFPAYTGMAAQTVDNEGDISALRGTRVDLSIHAVQPVGTARLLFDDKSSLELTSAGPRAFTGSLSLQRSGSYVVELEGQRGKRYTGSPEYEIQVLDDAPPKIAIAKPLRDLRATNVEEVFTELKAEDDIGLGRVELHFSVNGGEERTLRLYDGRPSQAAVTAAHTFFLEEFRLQPGDVISYYGKALDNNAVSGPGSASSDIYFIQIRPFEQKYMQSQQGGGPSGPGEGQEALSRQQKEIISATFKLIRDKMQMDPKEYGDGLKALALVQGRLQAQALGLVQRLKRRGAADVNQDFAKLTDYLGTATEEMGKAATALGVQKPSDALPAEQKALQQLMRAESLFREIQISFAAQMNPGAGSQANAEDLADLFELELNKLKNQYETVQRGEQQARDQKIDEAMERLKELARRQQQVNERIRALSMRGGSSSGGADSGPSQQQLMDEARQLQRQLQRLSRERSSPELNSVSSQLEKAIQEMKQSLERGERKSLQEANARGVRALQQLEDARRALARGQQAGLNQGLEQAVQESKRILEEQRHIQEGIQRLARDKQQSASPEFQNRREELTERKSLLADRVRNLGKSLDDLSGTARKTQREAGSKLSDASAFIRDKKLAERILSGNQLLSESHYDLMKDREDYIRSSLEELAKQLESAQGTIGQTRESRLEDAVNKTRQLADGLDSMRRRLQDQRQAAARPEAKPGQPDSGAAQGGQSQGSRAGQGEAGRREQDLKAPSRAQDSLAAGAGPETDARGRTRDTWGPPTGGGRPEDEAGRQFRRETQERLMDAQELRRLLDRNSTQMQNLEKVIESLRNLSGAGGRSEAEQIARLKAAIELLSSLDQDLSRELAQLIRKENYFYAEDTEAPSAYRKLVDEYYRALAKGKP